MKIKIKSEIIYLFSITMLSFSVAMCAAADFGVSMIVAPAYILSLRFPFISFGQSEYILQAVLFIVFCLLRREFKLVFLFSFFTCLFYGAMLDLWRLIIPIFNPSIFAPGSFPMAVRILFFALSAIMTAFSISSLFHTYLYPQVWDFFVKGISKHFNIKLEKFKIGFDVSCLILSLILTLVFFKGIKGIGIGTVILTLFNGLIISFFNKVYDKHIKVEPLFPKLEKRFEL